MAKAKDKGKDPSYRLCPRGWYGRDGECVRIKKPDKEAFGGYRDPKLSSNRNDLGK